MERHFTSNVFIVDDDKVLLIYHKKLSTWLPPGGHIDANETPVDSARREVFEETGLEIEIMMQENAWVQSDEARSFQRPYLCLIEDIPEYRDTPAHQHIDMVYLAKNIRTGIEKPNYDEVREMRWFSRDDIEALTVGENLLFNVKMVLDHIFDHVIPVTCPL
ncbi:MAG: NUDIX domain-containing protein [Waddliaceae bacterium]|jgi:ADP-ribose pyrophosphatase YjhB (NUDIX family)|nr:NUDIX domain-containing protein [Waddliaceae bacterium]MBT3579656.1 NUDIX domain-containing protein [Waddliaceae bacterium]MBT4445241.1 NUDIX domain-containing protein [Waddliaceae bacterium]MBT6928099.1 NUDIX domain-containing protein [Waddliaceae bacterium]MBT7264660.1 NUDIX domain-containing protein [Waddliaceae bacterium]